MNLDLRDTRTSALRRARTCGSLYLRRDCRRCTEPSLLRSVRSHRGTDLPQTQQATPFDVVVNALVSINEVNLRQARLVLGWVTVSGVQLPVPENLSQYITSHPGQLSLATLLCCWGVKAGMVREWVTGKTV